MFSHDTPSKQILQVLRDGKLGPHGQLQQIWQPDQRLVGRRTTGPCTGRPAESRSASEDVGTNVEPFGLPAAQLPSKPSDLASQATNSNSQQMQVGLYC